MNPYGSMDMHLGAIALKPFVWVKGQLWQWVDRSLSFVWRKNGGVDEEVGELEGDGSVGRIFR